MAERYTNQKWRRGDRSLTTGSLVIAWPTASVKRGALKWPVQIGHLSPKKRSLTPVQTVHLVAPSTRVCCKLLN